MIFLSSGVAFFQMGGAILGLFPQDSDEEDSGIHIGDGISQVYLAYNTRSDAEVDTVLTEVERAGGKIVKAAGRAFWRGWYGYFDHVNAASNAGGIAHHLAALAAA